MIVGALELALRLDGCYSLKDKRRILRALTERARRDFRVAVAEVADTDLWNVATLAVAFVGNDPVHVRSVLDRVRELFERHPEVVVEGASASVERPSFEES